MAAALALDIRVPLDRFDLAVRWEPSGASLGVFGPSGSGKTTLLETLAGLRPRARGRIEVAGEIWMDSSRGIDLPPQRRGVGYVPQDLLLFPHRDVMGNLLAGSRRALRRGRPIPLERVLEVLELGDLRARPVTGLSGGERQRVALGRALCSGPDLLLLDEPLAGLDAQLRRRATSLLLRLGEEFGIPTVHVSHDASEMRLLSAEMAVLRRGEMAAAGSPGQLFRRPELWPEAARGGFENHLRGSVARVTGSTAVVALPGGTLLAAPLADLRAGRRVVLGLPAAAILLAMQPPPDVSARNILPARVVSIGEERTPGEPEGEMLVEVMPQNEDRSLVAALTHQAVESLRLSPGSSVHLVWKTQALRVLASW